MSLYKSWLNACVGACVFVCMLLFSCNGGAEDGDTTSEEVDSSAAVEEPSWTDHQVFYQIPAPDEMISLIKEGGFDYNGEVLNPLDQVEQHVDQKGQALNLGIYTADLTFMATYGQFQESIRYFNVIIKLADKLGISSAFDEVLVDRVKNNLENSDSLEIISNDSYYSIVDNLEQSNRGKTLAVIATGGWLESLYIVVNLMDEFNPEDLLSQRLADQKLVFENLVLYLKKYENEPMVSSTIEDLNGLKAVFESLDETSANTTFKKTGAKKVLGGDGKVNMTAEQFEVLKSEIITLRNSIAGINIAEN